LWRNLGEHRRMTRSRPELIPAHRRALMLDHLRAHGAASVAELGTVTGASASTIRRDLDQLEEEGCIERSHGGALIQNRAPGATFEPEAARAPHLAAAAKGAIGRLAASVLRPGQSVIFDSGSTVMMAARAAVERGIALTAVTNDLGIGQVLAAGARIRLVVLGGTLRSGSLTLTGEPGQEFLRSLHADIAFVGTHAITGTTLSDTSLEVAATKRAMIAAARRTVLLADASKFQPAAFSRICDASAMDEIVTDAGAPADGLERLREAGVVVRLAGGEGDAAEAWRAA
jgi:DeoR family transcriptional regulator, aga operon transcriptional repressor